MMFARDADVDGMPPLPTGAAQGRARESHMGASRGQTPGPRVWPAHSTGAHVMRAELGDGSEHVVWAVFLILPYAKPAALPGAGGFHGNQLVS